MAPSSRPPVALFHGGSAMQTANAKDANSGLRKKSAGLAELRKPSRPSLFRSLSESRKLGWSSSASEPDKGVSSVDSRRSLKIKKPRRSGTANSTSSCSITTDTDSLERNRQHEMFRFGKGFSQPPPSSYHRLSEDLKKGDYGSIVPGPPPQPPVPVPMSEPTVDQHHSATTSISQTYPLPQYVHHGEPASPMDTYDQNQRRKASMSKLMRHLGETRIPPELVLLSPCQNAAVVEERVTSLRKDRTRSLDLRAVVRLQMQENPHSEGKENVQHVQRTRSLGPRRSVRRKGDGKGLLEDEGSRAQTLQNHRVRRTRKMAQIFGPELPYDLMVSAGCRLTGSLDEPQTDERDFSRSDLLEQIDPLSLEATSPTAEPIETKGSLLDPSTPTPFSPTAEHRKRTQKLAKFFGVSQQDISSSITPNTLRRASDVSLDAHQPYLQEVEVNVQVAAGRRFWSLSPDRAEYRHAQMTDAIDQLRTLKAS